MNNNTQARHKVVTFSAGLAGLVAGAAGVTTLVISDKVIRERIIERAKSLTNYLQDWSSEKFDQLDEQTINAKQIISEAEEMAQKQQEVKMKN